MTLAAPGSPAPAAPSPAGIARRPAGKPPPSSPGDPGGGRRRRRRGGGGGRGGRKKEKSLTFLHLRNILKMFGEPFAAWRWLVVGERVCSPYCYSPFARTAFSEGKFVVLTKNIRCCVFLACVSAVEGFRCVDEQNVALYFS